MENTRYDFSPIVDRKPFKLPKGARVALWLGVNIESVSYTHLTLPTILLV